MPAPGIWPWTLSTRTRLIRPSTFPAIPPQKSEMKHSGEYGHIWMDCAPDPGRCLRIRILLIVVSLPPQKAQLLTQDRL
ncbi:hypothetical protein HNQ08_004319 [Deinococcus humi]|uniref:Uncharacterized protein n=1 Tax=Deinococcus humi TaxID=662880 RepID=A0A7W8JYL9_9DEIO|nr:hypothetical protein [Deinococcus humi]